MMRGGATSAQAMRVLGPPHPQLRAVCRTLASEAATPEWSRLEPTQWRRVVRWSERQGLAPLLCRVFDMSGWPESIPSPVRAVLRRSRFATAASNFLFFGELQRVLDALGNQRSITAREVVVLKGADLAMTVYPSIALRPMCDVDLLVPRRHLDRVVRVMGELGYRPSVPEMAAGHRRLTDHAVTLNGGPRRCVNVELHWGLVTSDMDRRSPCLGWFWKQTEEWKNQGRASSWVRADRAELPEAFVHLKPAAHLLYLAAHLALQHGFEETRLLWLYDVQQLLRRRGDGMDWDELRRRAHELRWNHALLRVLTGVQDLFGASLPSGLVASLEENWRRHVQGRRCAEPAGDASRADGIVHQMRGLSWPGRLRYIRNHCFPRPSYVRWRYRPQPRWLWPVYYPYRWWIICKVSFAALTARLRWTRSNGNDGPARSLGAAHNRATSAAPRIARGLRALAAEAPLRVRVSGNCMAPWVHDGDVVEVAPAKRLWPGDVIAFRQQDRIRLHRVIGYRPHRGRLGLVTRGDSSPTWDSVTLVENVIGKVSGGECAPALAQIPVRHRLRALGELAGLLFRRLGRVVRGHNA